MPANETSLSPDQITQKLESFCAYRERCTNEIIQKLWTLQVPKEEHDNYIAYLIEQNFLNESRYIAAFVRGKSNIKKWGKNKIVKALQAKNIPAEKIKNALCDVDENAYLSQLQTILLKKNKLLNEENNFKRRQKLINFAQQKGYETDLILKILKQLNI